MNRLVRALAAGTALASIAAAGLARTAPQPAWPAKPIQVIVTFPPGGSSDAVFRMIVPRLNEKLGQPVIVDNRPGAGGNIGLALVAKAPADGYTLGLGAAGALSANVSLYPQMPFDAMKDFKPVAMLAAIPFVIVGNPSMKAKANTLRELIALAKAEPGKLSVGYGGNGTAMHLSAALFAQMANIQLNEVPYRGSGPVALDLMGGQLSLGVVDLPSALQQIKAGKLVAYAVTSAQRLPMLPDVPTVAEAGLPGYDSTGWFGIVAPAGTRRADRRAAECRDQRRIDRRDHQDQIARTWASSRRRARLQPSVPTSASETTKWANVIRHCRHQTGLKDA